MAPPTLYDEPARPGLMAPVACPAPPMSLSALLWSIAVVLAAVELAVELAVPY